MIQKVKIPVTIRRISKSFLLKTVKQITWNWMVRGRVSVVRDESAAEIHTFLM